MSELKLHHRADRMWRLISEDIKLCNYWIREWQAQISLIVDSLTRFISRHHNFTRFMILNKQIWFMWCVEQHSRPLINSSQSHKQCAEQRRKRSSLILTNTNVNVTGRANRHSHWMWKLLRRMFVHSCCVLIRGTGNVMESKRSAETHLLCFQHPCGRVNEKFRIRVANNSGSFSFAFRNFNKLFSFRMRYWFVLFYIHTKTFPVEKQTCAIVSYIWVGWDDLWVISFRTTIAWRIIMSFSSPQYVLSREVIYPNKNLIV